jgi:hypothetical protein
MPRYNVHHGLSIDDEDDDEEDEHAGDVNVNRTQFVLHSPSPSIVAQRNVPVPISNRRNTTSTTRSVSDTPSTVSRPNNNVYDRTDPFLYLFNIVADPNFPLDATNDRRTLRLISRLLRIGGDTSRFDIILHATEREFQRADQNRRRATRFYNRLLMDTQFPLRDLVSDTEDNTIDDNNNSGDDNVPATNEND